MSKVHLIKILPKYFNAVVAENKKAEYRFNDRHYEDGDILVLREWVDGGYTGGAISRRITDITILDNNHVLLSMSKISEAQYENVVEDLLARIEDLEDAAKATEL